MSGDEQALITQLRTLNAIAAVLNQAVDMRTALQTALDRLIDLMGLQTGWIFLRDPTSVDKWWGKGYTLAAHHNLPPALDLDSREAWLGGCECQGLCNKGKLDAAYNEVTCSRLAAAAGDRLGLEVHASVPLKSGSSTLGILNVAAHDWTYFTETSLTLLTAVGSQMGTALERARLYDLLQERRTHEQSALLGLSNQLLGRSDLTSLMTHLVQEACHLLNADACALLLPAPDAYELAFRAVTGWQDDPVAEGRRIPISSATLAGQAMQTQRTIHVPDIGENPRDATLPDWLRSEGFHSHTVVPLVVDYRSIGVMVLNNRTPRQVRDEDSRFLRLLANQAAIAIENTRLREEEAARQRLEDELAVGRHIQLTLLPQQCPHIPGWEFAATYRAAHQVGGDFYDFFELPGEPGRLGMIIADVSDKGVAAALFMALSRTTIRSAAISQRGPAEALMRANALILEDSWSDMFLSAFYAILDTNTGTLTYASGGHNHPLWWSSQAGELRELATSGIVLGLFEAITIEQATVQLAPGDAVIFFTDGLNEAMNALLEAFGDERLHEVILANAMRSAEELMGAILEAVNAFTGSTPQSDDLTLFIVRRTPPTPA